MQALTWSVTNRTEGVIEPGDLSDIADFDVESIRELTGGDLWEPRGPDDGWLIIDFQQTQTGRDLLESYDRKRAWDRRRKAKARKAKLAVHEDDSADQDDDESQSGGRSGGHSTGQVPVAPRRQGQARQGKALKASTSEAATNHATEPTRHLNGH